MESTFKNQSQAATSTSRPSASILLNLLRNNLSPKTTKTEKSSNIENLSNSFRKNPKSINSNPFASTLRTENNLSKQKTVVFLEETIYFEENLNKPQQVLSLKNQPKTPKGILVRKNISCPVSNRSHNFFEGLTSLQKEKIEGFQTPKSSFTLSASHIKQTFGKNHYETKIDESKNYTKDIFTRNYNNNSEKRIVSRQKSTREALSQLVTPRTREEIGFKELEVKYRSQGTVHLGIRVSPKNNISFSPSKRSREKVIIPQIIHSDNKNFEPQASNPGNSQKRIMETPFHKQDFCRESEKSSIKVRSATFQKQFSLNHHPLAVQPENFPQKEVSAPNQTINNKGRRSLIKAKSWTQFLISPGNLQNTKKKYFETDANLDTFSSLFNKRVIKYNLKENSYKLYDFIETIEIERFAYCSIDKDKVLISGGIDKKNCLITSSCFVLNLQTQQPCNFPDMLEERQLHSMTFYKDKVFIFGGVNKDNKILKSCNVYHTADQVWYRIPSMKYERKNPQVFINNFNGHIYVIGGINSQGNEVHEIEKLDSERLCWVSLKITMDQDFNLKEFIILENLSKEVAWKRKTLLLCKSKFSHDDKIRYSLFEFDFNTDKLSLKDDFHYISKQPVVFGSFVDSKIYLFKKYNPEIAFVNFPNKEWKEERFALK